MILQQSICKIEAFNMRVPSGKENPSQTGLICAMEGEDFNLFIFTDTSKTTETSSDTRVWSAQDFYRPQQPLITFCEK